MQSKRRSVAVLEALIPQLCICQLAIAQEAPAAGAAGKAQVLTQSHGPGTASGQPAEAPVVALAQDQLAQLAQPTDAAAAEPAVKRVPMQEDILVTGTRIRRKDLTTPAPISLINKQEIQATGRVSIGDFLQLLPEQGNAINTSLNNGGTGATRVSLRGLGVNRTLVLLNSRRYPTGGNGADGSVDLNSIPVSVIERIEILKDGASAIYGSDAIGGVINLITRKRMNGTELSGYAGTSTHGDGTIYDFSATTGKSNDSGGILVSVGYYTQKQVLAGDRDFARLPYAYDAVGTRTADGKPGPYAIGSSTVPAGSLFLTSNQIGAANGNTLYNNLIRACTAADRTTCPSTYIRDQNASGAYAGLGWRPYTSSNLPPNGDGYNFQPENYLVTPQERISLFVIGDQKIGNNARGYIEASFVRRTSDQKLAAEPLNLDTENITVSATNFYNPFGRDFNGSTAFVRRRLVEFGDRRTAQDIITYRLVGGIDGTLPEQAGPLKGWFWDFSFNYGRGEGTVIKSGNLKKPGLAAALGPSWVDAQGTPRCGTDANHNIAGCVPLNLFGGEGSIAPDQVTPLTFTGTLRGTNQLVAVQFNTSGELFKLLAERPIGVAAGYEYRIVSGENIPDPVTVAGETTGNKSDITRGHYYVNEGYGEISLPIISGQRFAQEIEATAAMRVFNYNTFGSDLTYKLGGRWSIIPDFTMRGTYSTGFRAPSVTELYGGLVDAFPSVTDPCRLASAPASCGTARGNGDLNTQERAPQSGNPDLKPETAKIFTAGVVVEPSLVKNLTITADYFNIRIEQAIQLRGAAVILAQCYPSDAAVAAGAVPALCELIQRDPNSHRLLNIFNSQTNVGSDQTAGVDMSLNYALPTELGRFAFIFDGTWLQRYNRRLADGTLIKARGTYDLGAGGAGGTYPAFKFISGLRWSFGGFGAGANMHFIGQFHECGDATGNFAGNGVCYRNTTYVLLVPSYRSYDLFASYSLNTSFGKTTLAVGVNNFTNTQPPFVYNAGNSFAQSDPTAYADGFMGRFFYARLGHAF